MKIAYIISAYKYPAQLCRLVSRLNGDSTEFFIHIDKKIGEGTYAQFRNGLARLPNVHFLKRYPCYWGGFGHVQASMEGINEIVASGIPFDYAILLTGQDYPLRTNAQIRTFFQQQHGNSFIDYFPVPTEQWLGGGLQRVQSWHVRWENREFVFPKNPNSIFRRRFLPGLRLFGGSSYWCLSCECIEYIHDFMRSNSKFVHFFKYVDVPDELFYQTILMNSPLAASIINDDLRYIEWHDPQAGSPAILGTQAFDKITASPKLFARKFDMNIDAEILDQIDSMMLMRGPATQIVPDPELD